MFFWKYFTFLLCFLSPMTLRAEHCEGPYRELTISEEHLEKIVAQHLLWLQETKKREQRGESADFDDERWANLCGAQLQRFDLSGMNLSRADLSEANLTKAVLIKTNLHRASLDNAILQKADLWNANLSQAYLYGTNLNSANLSEANLSRAILIANHDGVVVNLNQADLSSVNLTQAKLEEVNLSQANLSSANLTQAKLEEVNLSQTNLSSANLTQAKLEQANLNHAILNMANLSKANLTEANLDLASLIEANLSQVNLKNASLKKANLTEANLLRANLREADLQGARLVFTSVEKTFFWKTNLKDTIFFPRTGLPDLASFASTNFIDSIYYDDDVGAPGLKEFRAAYKKIGVRSMERKLTYAIKIKEQEANWNKGGWYAIGSFLSQVLFDWTCEYGVEPQRPLVILLVLIVVFVLIYWLGLRSGFRGVQIGARWETRIFSRSKKGMEKKAIRKEMCHKLPFKKVKTFSSDLRLLRIAFYFSIHSAFEVGWRHFEIGTWLERLQARQYSLEVSRGWMRTLGGLQSLISVYLIALWALTQFGQPFEF
ncbi:pentapeptide repeat-containing protein [Candidatus Parabeggiatoa sp. HSG14]|uniref:pentapeptide repeat-containing protein n=1 Tax=Candidatus Parabeggiatoa sp. HSG14 TaxID=3055593 RepID=UPI0025A8A9D6|nr:pentapeptide repeat-containing protein [Thiotrichales bacterium HSG14]